MAQPANFSGPLKGSRRVGDSTLSLDQMSLRDEKIMLAVRKNTKLDRLLGISDTTNCCIQAQQRKLQGTKLRKKSSNNGLKTSRDLPQNVFQRLKFQDEGRQTRGSSPVLGRDEVAGSLPSSMSSSSYSLDKPTSRDFFDHLNGRHDYSNPSSPTSYGESSLQKGFPTVTRQAYNMPGLTMAQQEARYQPVGQGKAPKTNHLGLSRFIPKICRPKRSATPQSEAYSYRQGSSLHPRNGRDWRHVVVEAQDSEDEDTSPPRVLRLPRSAKPIKSTEEMQKWLDESQIADKPDRENTPAFSSDSNSQIPSPTFSKPLSEQSTSTTSIQTLTSQKSTKISRRLREHAIPQQEDLESKSKAKRAHDKCVAWNLVPNHRDSRNLQQESMLSISSSDDDSRTSRDFSSPSKPRRSVVNFSKPRLSRDPSVNPSPEKLQAHRVDLQKTQQDSFQSIIGSPNPWYWSGAKRPDIAIDQAAQSPPSARRKSIPNVIGEMESGLDISIDLAIDMMPGRHSPPRRFMAVTEHEERLLEAMREKRASMKVESSTEDDTTVWSQKSESPRPKTAGGLVRSPTILHGTDVSSFPSPPKLSSKVFSRAMKTAPIRSELRADLMRRSYLASVNSIDSPLLVASENTAVTRLARYDVFPPDYLHSPVSEVSPITPTTEQLPSDSITAKGAGMKLDNTLGVDRVSKISSKISLKSGEGELVSAIEERERDGDTSDDEDLVVWAMEVSVR